MNPVTGTIYRKGDNRVIIKPTDASFTQFEIVIDNIDARKYISAGGTYMEAGKKMGKVTKSKCKPNFFHVAMRKAVPEDLPTDEEYDYVNPEPHLDRIIPIPQWVEECNDFFFRHIFETVDAGALDENGAQDVVDKIERKVQEEVDKMEEMAAQQPEFELEKPSATINEAEGSFMDNVKSALPSFGNLKSLFDVDR